MVFFSPDARRPALGSVPEGQTAHLKAVNTHHDRMSTGCTGTVHMRSANSSLGDPSPSWLGLSSYDSHISLHRTAFASTETRWMTC